VVDAGDEGITVQVIDDGRGISPVEVDSSDSLGLIGMRERAGSVGGRMEVRRRKTKGTVVRLYLPLPEGTSASTRRDSSTARSRPARQRLS
ncbi:MAG: hypothetical protein R3174_14965, partial [Gammaproteobacteria bacterium]|nr:hypothetical protein [Gammaproteobacteria bacterium]